MITFVAIYRGDSAETARLIAVSVDPDIVQTVARRLVVSVSNIPATSDPASLAVVEGQTKALQLIGGT